MRLGNKYWREREICQDEAFPWDIESRVYIFQSVPVPLFTDKKNSRRTVTLLRANPPLLQTLSTRSLSRGLICVKICWHLLWEVNIWKQSQAEFVPRNQCCWHHACSFMAAAKQTLFPVAVLTIRMWKLFIHHKQELKKQQVLTVAALATLPAQAVPKYSLVFFRMSSDSLRERKTPKLIKQIKPKHHPFTWRVWCTLTERSFLSWEALQCHEELQLDSELCGSVTARKTQPIHPWCHSEVW